MMEFASVIPSIPIFEARCQPGDPPTVYVVGEVDLGTRDRLAEVLDKAVRHGCDLIVDCVGIRFIDASGISVLLGAARSIGDGRLRLVNVHGALAYVIDLLELASEQPNLSVERHG